MIRAHLPAGVVGLPHGLYAHHGAEDDPARLVLHPADPGGQPDLAQVDLGRVCP